MNNLVSASIPEPEYLTVRNGLPQGFVNSMLQDRRGFIWLSTLDGLCRYDGVRFRVYAHDPQQKTSLSFSSIYQIKEDDAGQLWVRTENNNIDRFDPVTETSQRISGSAQFQKALGRDQLTDIAPDREGNVWVVTQTNGFFRLNTDGTVSHHYWQMQGNIVQRTLHHILLDGQNRLWLSAKDGLFRFDIKTGAFAGFRLAQGLPQNDVHRLHQRTNGQLILGFPGHFAVFDPNSGRVQKVVPLPGNPAHLPIFARDFQGIDYVDQSRYTDQQGLVPLLPQYDAVFPMGIGAGSQRLRFSPISLLVDRTNVLWLGLNGNGIIKYDLDKRLFQAWPYVNNFQTDWLTQQLHIPIDAIPAVIRQQLPVSYQFDHTNALWINSDQAAPYRYDAHQQTFVAVKPVGIEARWLPPGTPFRLTAMSTGVQGEIWGLLGPQNQAIVRYNPDRGNFTAFPLPLPVNNPYVVRAMLVDGARVYLATKNHGLIQADLLSKRLTHWHGGTGNASALPEDALLCLAQDPTRYNHLWIGTSGQGLCLLDKLTGQIRQFSTRQGLPNNVIYAIRPDHQGHLWLSSNRGICRFDTRTFEVRSYTADDGLPGDEFNLYNDVTLPDGRLIFGSINGYTIFNPKHIGEDPFKPKVALTALRINNQLITPNTPGSPIQRSINQTSEITLTHDQNFLSLDFAALQYNQSRKNQYRYKLIGLDDDWVYSGNQATAVYTNLPPQTYAFVVNASNTSGIWSPYTHKLTITIEPPFWATWWAYAGYALQLLVLLSLYVWIRIRRIQQKNQLALREQETIQLKKLDEVKTRFFANITHELRTPLTLIISPLSELLTETAKSPLHGRLTLVYQNANRLLRLINELLDLAKLEAGNLAVTTTVADLPNFVQQIIAVFSAEAQRKQIDLHLTQQLRQFLYWFDSDKIEKILTNLLSNALKFTDSTGSITVSLQADPIPLTDPNSAPLDLIQLTVHNTGPIISDYNLPYVFDRFYQATPVSEGSGSGSGIGLALVKELVDLMKGTISVESTGALGTTFTVTIPCQQAPPTPLSDEQSTRELATAGHSMTDSSQAATDKANRILLVEDDNDIADYVTSILRTDWQVDRVNNGRLGVEAALEDGPDLIISDVLMPELTGYELCHQLKSNPLTNHIPIILLTAKVAIESRLEGLAAGADDYLAKPFQVEELRGRVRNQLAQQQRIRQHYRIQLLQEGNLPVVSQAPEDEFMNRIYGILEARLDDSTLGVEQLAHSLGISRMHLNRKVKAMTDLTPTEFIRTIRLKRAAELLLTGAPISEVADRVGFDTPAYFSKVFKDQFHVTPSEYIEKNRHEMV